MEQGSGRTVTVSRRYAGGTVGDGWGTIRRLRREPEAIRGKHKLGVPGAGFVRRIQGFFRADNRGKRQCGLNGPALALQAACRKPECTSALFGPCSSTLT